MKQTDVMLCICGHRHWTTRGPCTHFDTCKCRHLRPQRVKRNPPQPEPEFVDTQIDITRRTRELMDAVEESFPRGIKAVTRRKTR